MSENGKIATDGEDMNLLPRHDKAVIPVDKFTKYCLNPDAQPDKALAFHQALGYDMTNYNRLIANIRHNIPNFPAVPKGDDGHGMKYEVLMSLYGPNCKNAKVMTAWIDDKKNGEMRLISAYVDK